MILSRFERTSALCQFMLAMVTLPHSAALDKRCSAEQAEHQAC